MTQCRQGFREIDGGSFFSSFLGEVKNRSDSQCPDVLFLKIKLKPSPVSYCSTLPSLDINEIRVLDLTSSPGRVEKRVQGGRTTVLKVDSLLSFDFKERHKAFGGEDKDKTL